MSAPFSIVTPSALEKAAMDAIAARREFDAVDANGGAEGEWNRLLAIRDEATIAFKSALHKAGISQGLMRALLYSGVVW